MLHCCWKLFQSSQNLLIRPEDVFATPLHQEDAYGSTSVGDLPDMRVSGSGKRNCKACGSSCILSGKREVH